MAHLAGVPENVIRRAKVILSEISSEGGEHPAVKAVGEDASDDGGQVSLESMATDEVGAILRNTDINTITPLEAMNLLYELKRKVT